MEDTTIRMFKPRNPQKCNQCSTQKDIMCVEFIKPNGTSRFEYFCDKHLKELTEKYKAEMAAR